MIVSGASLSLVLVLLLALQGLAMLWDELYFHRQRGLNQREAWGHLVDTGLFAAAVAIPSSLSPSSFSLSFYCGISLLSSVVITKDEGIHTSSCGAGEHWCHALLFVVHGAILTLLGVLWMVEPQSSLFKFLPAGVIAWAIFQHLSWNANDAKKFKLRAPEHQQQFLRRAE